MSLPNPGMSFTPFDPLPASDLNDIVENIEALAAGTGLNDDAVTAPKIVGIDKSNLTTDYNPYKFRARRVAAQSVTSSTQTKIAFDTEDYDTNNNHSNGTYTAPVAGFYTFAGYVNIAGGTNIMTLYKNGVGYQRGTQSGSGGVTSYFEVQSAQGDTWEIWIFITGGTIGMDVSATLQPYFTGHLRNRT